MNFEQTVIGGLLLDGSALATVRTILEPKDFGNVNLAEVYRAMINLDDNNQPLDCLCVAEELENNKYLTNYGLHQLTGLEEHTASAANIAHYAEKIKDQGLKRKVANIAVIAQEAETGAEAVELAIAELTASGSGISNTNFHINDALNEVIEDIEAITNNTRKFIKSGLEQLDAYIHGFEAGRLYVIAARPGMGKSVLALNIAQKTALEGKPVKIFSLEMPKAEVAYRMVCSASNMNTKAKYNMQDDDYSKITAGFSKLKDQPIEVDDGSGYTVGYLKNAIRTHAQKNAGGLYVVDYLQLIRINGHDRVSGIGEVTRELKALAKEVKAPIILLSQLSRNVESRPDKRPNASDLRESGEIEQDADVIIMIYRDEVYNEQTEHKGIAELLIRKNRTGESGTAFVASTLQYSRFDNLARM